MVFADQHSSHRLNSNGSIIFFHHLVPSLKFNQKLLLSKSLNYIDVNFDSVVVLIMSCKSSSIKNALQFGSLAFTLDLAHAVSITQS